MNVQNCDCFEVRTAKTRHFEADSETLARWVAVTFIKS
uniref:Uncharacterized protein n=1 Tax=Tetraselmis sp. GSL018 TaxID=582737 RepID=A0A061R5W6_9CHLO